MSWPGDEIQVDAGHMAVVASSMKECNTWAAAEWTAFHTRVAHVHPFAESASMLVSWIAEFDSLKWVGIVAGS